MSLEPPQIVVIDEGELEDVREILDSLDIEFTHWDKDAVPSQRPYPELLLVTTATHAVSLRLSRQGTRREGGPIWIAVVTTDTRSQRNLLLQAGFDYLVRRPVHPAALRLLLRRAVYRGEDQRRGRRVAVGYEVTLRTGWWPKKATLVDLSARGARVLTRSRVERGEDLTLQIPGQLAGGRPFSLRAVVVRVRPGELEGGEVGETSLGLRFARPEGEARDRMVSLFKRLASGPASYVDTPPAAKPTPVEPKRPYARSPRAVYQGEVLMFGDENTVLVGRDLSRGGMRVERHPALQLNDAVRLAIEAGSEDEQLLVCARVARDDGERGFALQFESFESGCEQRVASLVESLPSIEELSEGAAGPGQGIVLSRMIPNLLRLSGKRRIF
jgi:hypothetical protein